MTDASQKINALKWKLGRKLLKPIGQRKGEERAGPSVLEFHAPDPEVHAAGPAYMESETPEKGGLCPACKSPTHAHDVKCPWCGADLGASASPASPV